MTKRQIILISLAIFCWIRPAESDQAGTLKINLTEVEATQFSFAYELANDAKRINLSLTLTFFTAFNEQSWENSIDITDPTSGTLSLGFEKSFDFVTPHFLYVKAKLSGVFWDGIGPSQPLDSNPVCDGLMFSSGDTLSVNDTTYDCSQKLKISYNMDFTCADPSLYTLNCDVSCQAQNNENFCYDCDVNGKRVCCNANFDSANNCARVGSVSSTTESTGMTQVGGSSSTLTSSTNTNACPTTADDCDSCKTNEKIYFWSMIGVAAFGALCVIIILILILCCAKYYKRSKRYGYGSNSRPLNNYRTSNIVYPGTGAKNGSVQLYERPHPIAATRSSGTAALSERPPSPLPPESSEEEDDAQSTAVSSIRRQYSVPVRRAPARPSEQSTNPYSTIDYGAIGARPRGDPPPYGTPASERPVSYV